MSVFLLEKLPTTEPMNECMTESLTVQHSNNKNNYLSVQVCLKERI